MDSSSLLVIALISVNVMSSFSCVSEFVASFTSVTLSTVSVVVFFF